MRPETLDEIVGQDHLLGKDKPLRRMIERGELHSMILWGPPGSGKTTLALAIARYTRAIFVQFSAVTSGVADIRDVVKRAQFERSMHNRQTILFVDEIHRFNKAQQDAFLPTSSPAASSSLAPRPRTRRSRSSRRCCRAPASTCSSSSEPSTSKC